MGKVGEGKGGRERNGCFSVDRLVLHNLEHLLCCIELNCGRQRSANDLFGFLADSPNRSYLRGLLLREGRECEVKGGKGRGRDRRIGGVDGREGRGREKG